MKEEALKRQKTKIPKNQIGGNINYLNIFTNNKLK
jgi:hypothetical protein